MVVFSSEHFQSFSRAAFHRFPSLFSVCFFHLIAVTRQLLQELCFAALRPLTPVVGQDETTYHDLTSFASLCVAQASPHSVGCPWQDVPSRPSLRDVV